MPPIEPNPAQPLAPGPARWLTLGFLALLVAVPLSQVAGELRRGERPQVQKLFTAPPTLAHLDAFESELDEASLLARAIRPWIQRGLLAYGQGNRKVVVGRGGWLFFRPTVEHHTGRPIPLDEDKGRPLTAILAYHRALAARGIELIVVPVPTKLSLHPEQLWPGSSEPVANPAFEPFLARLREAGVTVVDLRSTFAAAKRQGGSYLPYDTHWRPELMELAADRIAALLPAGPRRVLGVETVRHRGDLYDMLDLPATAPARPEVEVTIHPLSGWAPDPDAPVILLGDSFTNIYSDPQLGWGAGAGLAEQLAARIGPLDLVASNDGGVNGTRQALARRRGRLDSKTTVIWQFAARDLTAKADDWAVVPPPASRREMGP